MGTRVTVAITNPTIGEEDVIFWCNATSFSPMEVVENLACGSKTLDELIAKLKDYASYSSIASRDERFFSEEISYPFGDCEYILYVEEDLKINKLSLNLYCLLRGRTKDEVINYNFGRTQE